MTCGRRPRFTMRFLVLIPVQVVTGRAGCHWGCPSWGIARFIARNTHYKSAPRYYVQPTAILEVCRTAVLGSEAEMRLSFRKILLTIFVCKTSCLAILKTPTGSGLPQRRLQLILCCFFITDTYTDVTNKVWTSGIIGSSLNLFYVNTCNGLELYDIPETPAE